MEPVATDEFQEWYSGLSRSDQEVVERLVDLLWERGVKLGFPYSSAIKGTKHPIRELRAKSESILRIFYAFDPTRAAVLLIGGDKRGDDRFYERMIPLAERIWEQYLREQNH